MRESNAEVWEGVHRERSRDLVSFKSSDTIPLCHPSQFVPYLIYLHDPVHCIFTHTWLTLNPVLVCVWRLCKSCGIGLS